MMGSMDESNKINTESDSVIDIVNKDPSLIPQQYLRSEEDRAEDIDFSLQYSSQIPILDLFLLYNRDQNELHKLDKACQEWGFFQVINHGIKKEIMESIQNGAAEYFQLPLEEKKKCPYDPSILQGYGVHYQASKEDQILDWSDSIMFRVCPFHLRKSELWPANPPSFKDAVETYSAEVKKVAERLFGSLSIVMGMEKESGLLGLQKDLHVSMRINYYPTCSKPDKVLGLSPHSDPSTISILTQNNDVIGLQIRHNGGWVPVKPVPNALIINVGDALEIMSNGKYKSIEHRAVTSETKTRISIGTFVSPDDNVEIGPIKEVLDMQQKPAIYKKIRYEDFLTTIMSRKIQGKEHVKDYTA